MASGTCQSQQNAEMCKNAKIKHGKNPMLAWCFQTSVKGWLQSGWFSFGLVASSAESKTRGSSGCQEPNPDHGVAAASGGGASEAALRTLCSSCEGGTGDSLNFVQIIRSNWNLELVLFGCFCFQPSVRVTEVGLGSSSEHVKQLCWLSGVFQPTSSPLWQCELSHQAILALAKWYGYWSSLGFLKAPAASATVRNVCWWTLDLIIILWPGVVIPVFLLTCSVPYMLGMMVPEIAGGRWRAFSGTVNLLGSAAGQGKLCFHSVCDIGGSSLTH